MEASNQTEQYSVTTELNDGIERITYTPRDKRHDTPILMQHGMWHGAWCWAEWQGLLAQQGWESHAISLPGHGASPAQKSVRFSTMGDYLKVLKQEVDRLPHKPILMGHSMGGALAQWYLKKVADDLPAVERDLSRPIHVRDERTSERTELPLVDQRSSRRRKLGQCAVAEAFDMGFTPAREAASKIS